MNRNIYAVIAMGRRQKNGVGGDPHVIPDRQAPEPVQKAERIDAAPVAELDMAGISFKVRKRAQLTIGANPYSPVAPHREPSE
ncbi:MAG TPA: hypothetical protein VNJ04_03370 [Gemmatimonadaceae bacterium]|nr:hypothetical protein [Gemmatimonadaceae bacterium]